MKVLVADDDEIIRNLVFETLTAAGYEVIRVADGQQAWEQIEGGEIRLVVSDWLMPKISGVELCKKIRAANLPGYVYFLLLTAQNKLDHLIEGLSAGADDFIRKPFHLEELKVRVRAGERILALETRDLAIFAMAKLAESRDTETGRHLERMQGYCRILAEHLATEPAFAEQIDSEFIRHIELTSPLHDIGKIGIPDSILLKPGRLTEEEYEIMKTHSRIGGDTLEAALKRYPETAYLKMARDITLYHHERYDGTGYPLGLRGDAIPLSARIAALADVYDALCSKRVYKESFSHHVARKMIVEESGGQFDPAIVDGFLASEASFHRVRSLNIEKEKLRSIAQ